MSARGAKLRHRWLAERPQLRRLALALAVGTAGGLTFQLLHLPLAWMLGPLTFNLVAA
jgi:uncharacterized membrane protein AbrB (regulator of aidB expression)